MKIANFFIVKLLTSPLHWILSRNTLLVHFTGWKSGKQLATPVNYTQQGDVIRITSKRSRVWWRNLVHLPMVSLTLRGEQAAGRATVFREPQAVVEAFVRFLKPAPEMAKYFHIPTLPNGELEKKAVESATQDMVVIEVDLNPKREAEI